MYKARREKSTLYERDLRAEFRATEVWQKDVKTDMHTTSGKAQRVEKLFVNHTS